MRLCSVRVQNFRSLRDQDLRFDDLTALVGANGVGKSSFLKALEYFYVPAPTIETEDFYAKDTTQSIDISVTYSELTTEEREVFREYEEGGMLTVSRSFGSPSTRPTVRYHGMILRHSGFDEVRAGLAIKDRGATARPLYDGLRAQTEYSSLVAWTTLRGVEDALRVWEVANPGECARGKDDGTSVGFGPSNRCDLGRFTRLLYVPAVRDAAVDAGEARGSILTSLMDLLVRSSLSTDPRLERLRGRTQALYERALSTANQPGLTALGEELTETLKTLVPDSSVQLEWLPLPRMEMPLPTADVSLIEDGYGTDVAHTGHGLQRAFIITLLQHLSSAQFELKSLTDTGGQASAGPDLILAIEEPELYQHPSRQRHFAKTLLRLASGKLKGLAARTQVVYATHSPLFVGIDRISNIRLLKRKRETPLKPKTTIVLSADLTAVARRIWVADGSKGNCYTAESLLSRLRTIMTPLMGEGFFARIVILVEGEDDRAALLGVSDHMNLDLEAFGIAIIPAGGKTNLDRPYAIFSALGIPVYPVWDVDTGSKDAKAEDNHRLLRLLDQPVVDWPPSTVQDSYACFAVNLESTLRSEIGTAVFDSLLAECQKEYGIPKASHALKNPAVLSLLIGRAIQQGAQCPSLIAILTSAAALSS